MLSPKVSDYLEANFPRHLGSLCELLAIPSIANMHDDRDACQAAAQWLVRYIRQLGMSAQAIRTSDQEHDRPAVVASLHVDDRLPTLLMYAHYDVQPAEPLEQWISPPFEPVVREGMLFGRGVSDDKGQLMAQLMAIEAYLKTGTKLPVNLKLFYEGEEEVGSPNLGSFMQASANLLKADAAVITDVGWIAPDTPSIAYGLRGLAGLEVTFTGPSRDIHSGSQGGAVRNPINALAALIAHFHDASGRVAVEGFYDDVLPLSDQERRQWQLLPPSAEDDLADLGLECFSGGEEGFTPTERRWARPTLDCNGIVGGYTGRGAKTIIPSTASVKITCRLVPNQDPQKIAGLLKAHVQRHTPPGIKAQFIDHASNPPFIADIDSPVIQAGREALAETTGRQVAMIRCGGSIGAAEKFQTVLGLKPLLMGFDLPGCRIHSPNECISLEQIKLAARTIATFMDKLGR